MQIIVTIEVPEWVKERLSVEDNTAAWDWVNTRTACVTAESVFGNWPGVGWISEYERAMSKTEHEFDSYAPWGVHPRMVLVTSGERCY